MQPSPFTPSLQGRNSQEKKDWNDPGAVLGHAKFRGDYPMQSAASSARGTIDTTQLRSLGTEA